MPKIKRESRSFIVINEEKLILEVQKRPILYDKALKGYRKPVTRENAWQEVSELLESPVEECKKRWRSLRDAFMKQYKLFQRGETSMRKRWLFYEQMEFLGPYFDADGNMKYDIDAEFIVERDTDGIPSKLTSTSFNGQQQRHIICLNESDPIDYQAEAVEIHEYDELDEEEEEDESSMIVSKAEPQTEVDRSQSSTNVTNDSVLQSNPSASSSHYHSNDPNERFLLSCLPTFQRLSNKKNALARMKIQELLFDIEFSDDNS